MGQDREGNARSSAAPGALQPAVPGDASEHRGARPCRRGQDVCRDRARSPCVRCRISRPVSSCRRVLRLLKQSRLDNSRDALMIELTTIDLLIVDDFALEPMSRDESRDVYQLLVERNARASTIVTSNRDTA